MYFNACVIREATLPIAMEPGTVNPQEEELPISIEPVTELEKPQEEKLSMQSATELPKRKVRVQEGGLGGRGGGACNLHPHSQIVSMHGFCLSVLNTVPPLLVKILHVHV